MRTGSVEIPAKVQHLPKGPMGFLQQRRVILFSSQSKELFTQFAGLLCIIPITPQRV